MTERTPAWVWGLHLLLVWITVEDTVRKFLLNSLVVYLVKDILVLLVVAGALASPVGRRSLRLVPRPLAGALAWGFLLYVIGSFHPELPSPLVPLNGLRLTFVYVPLLVVGLCYSCEGRDPALLLRTVLVVGALVAGVGIYQALVNPSFLTPEPSEELAGLQIGMTRAEGVAYVTSTFLSPARYVVFLLVAVAAGLAIALLCRRRRARAFTLGGLALVTLGLLTSGARIGIVGLTLLVLGSWLLLLKSARSTGGVRRRREGMRDVLRLVALAGVGIAIVLVFSERVRTIVNFYQETLADPESGVRSRAEVNLAFLQLDAETWLFGHGTGSASFGIQYIVPDVEFSIEGGYAAMVWELGFLGLAFYLALALQVSRVFLVPPPGLAPTSWRPLSAALGSLVLLSLWVLNLLGASLQQYVVAIPLWLFTGVVLGLRSRPEAASSP